MTSFIGRLAGLRRIDLQVWQQEDYYGYVGEMEKYFEKAGQIELGAATLNVMLGSRQIATFPGTPKGGVARSIRESDLWS